MKILSTPKDVRPWWVLLFVLLAALVLVGQAGATWIDNFQVGMGPTGDIDGYVCGDVQTYKNTYDDMFGVITGGTGFFYYEVDYPSNYLAYTLYSGSTEIKYLDASLNVLLSKTGVGDLGICRFQFKRESINGVPHIKIYKNGVYISDAGALAEIPHFYEILGGFLVDDLVIGSEDDDDVVGCMPDGWFVAKDIFDPGFSGLYDEPEHVVYIDSMHVSYANHDGNCQITITNVDSGTVINSTSITGSYAGFITYNLTNLFFNSGAPYGLYRVQSSGTAASDDFWYRAVSTSGTSVQWDDTDYADGDEATITFSISETNWDIDTYGYSVEIWDESLNEVESWAVPSRPLNATKTIDVNTANFGTSGTFYCVLTATDLSSGDEVLICNDDAEILLPGSGEVVVSGVTYDATTNLTLTSCTVTGTQLGSTQSTTSDAVSGAYEISDFVTDWSLGMNASKTGYIGYLMAFTPYESGTYTVDIPLVPSGGPAPDGYSNATTSYYNSTIDGTAVGGLCYQGPYWTLGEGCNVTVSNSTWNTSCTTGAGGWYQCNNIGAGGTYSLSCSKSGYTPYTTSCSLEEGCFNREDCTLEASNALTVNCKDLTSLMLLSDSECTVTLDTGQECTTSNGTAIFYDLPYGSYTCTASALGYYPGSTGVVMDAAKEVDCYLTSSESRSGGSGVAYAPKSVKFSVQTLWGKAITNCTVTCCGHETTAGSWSWLYSLFGIDANSTPIANSTMTGTTDERGSINFLMLEPVEYTCSFVKAGEINKNITLYPKDEYYLILATEYGNSSWLEGGVDINAAINCTIATAKCNSTAAYINLTYFDTTNATTGGTCYLNQTNATAGGPPVCLQSTALSAGCSSGCNLSFLVNNYAGKSYLVNVDPTHSTWDFTRSFTVTFPPAEVNPLGLTSTELMLISTFFIIFTGCLFGAISAPHAPLMMSFMGWICWALGWMGKMETTITAALVLASVLSVLFLVMVRSKKERWV